MAIGVNANTSSGDIASVTATTTITLPTGTNATDIVVVIFGDDRASAVTINTVSAPTGWTAIFTAIAQASGNNEVKLSGFWALGNVSNLGFTNSQTGASHQQGWICTGYTGVDNSTPIDATGTTNSNTASSTITTNAVTVVTDQAWHLIAVADFLGKVAYTATSFTEKHNAAANAAAAIMYNTTPKSTGSTGTVVVSNSDGTTTNEIFCAAPFALRPAAGGGGSTTPPTTPAGDVEGLFPIWEACNLL